jgi:hypothetical protein
MGNATVVRGPGSLAVFYGVYAAMTAVVLTIATTANAAENHRVLYVLWDAGAIAYLCLINAWFKERLIRLSNWLPTI